MHIYTYIMSAHIYTYTYIHTHTKCTYERTQSTSETTARQRLRGRPKLTPRSSALLPVHCNLEGDTLRGQQPNCLSTRNDRYAQNNLNQHQLITPSLQRVARPHPLICTSAELIHPVHGPPKLLAWPWSPEMRSFSCHFGGFSATPLRLRSTLDSNFANSWRSGDTTMISKQAESAQ